MKNISSISESILKEASDQDVKEYVSEHIKEIRDQAFATVLRDALFTFGKIDWQRVKDSIRHNMPEVKKFRGPR